MKTIIACIIILCLLTGTALSWSEGQKVRIFKMQYRLAEELYPVAAQLKSDEGKVSADPNTNSLIVVDYPKNLESIAEIIEKLDIAEKQVEIKVVINDVSEAVFNEIGLASGQATIPHSRVKAVMDLINTNRDSKTRSEMMVRTLSSEPANIQVAADQIYGYAIISDWYGGKTVEPLRTKVGNMLEVLPRVNPDGTILVTLRPSSSVIRKNGSINEKSILTQVVINNGDTIAIGGADSMDQDSVSGTPMFGKTSGRHKKVVMFLTATICN